MNKTIALIAIASMVGCVSGSLSDAACYSGQPVSFPVPASITDYPVGDLGWGPLTLPAIQSPPIQEDFSNTLSKITDVSDSLTTQLSSISLSNENGDLSWVKGINAYVAEQGSTEQHLFAQYTAGATVRSTITLSQVIKNGTLFGYLSSGPVEITVQINSSTVDTATVKKLYDLHGSLSSSLSVCIEVSGSASKSL